MQLPTVVPREGPPSTVAVVTRPEEAKVTLTGIVERGSPGSMQLTARRPATEIATAVAGRLIGAGARREAASDGRSC